MPIATPSVRRGLPGILAGVSALAACASGPVAPQSGPPFDAVWQRHEATINYFGLTALYSCDGFEDKVRTILLYLGARSDLKVQQLGCNRAFDRPGHLAIVRADFYTLAPASKAASNTTPDSARGTVSAQWTPVTIRPMDPYWIGFGECELLQQIKPVIAGDYSTRDLHYRTACIPREATFSDFDLSGQFPKPTASH